MATKLGDLIDAIMSRQDWRQNDLANYLGMRQPAVSKMRVSNDWCLHSVACFKLLQLCKQLGIDASKYLDTEGGYKNEVGRIAGGITGASEFDSRGKKGTKKPPAGAVPAGRSQGSKRR